MVNSKAYEIFKGMEVDECQGELDISDHNLITGSER